MASSLTEEKTYYLRLVALTIGIAPKAVRRYFNSVFPPLSLATELKKNETKLKHLRFSLKVLTSAQWITLFPTGSVNVSSTDFDLTLMVCLLRNLSGVTPPALGFDCLPPSTDIGVADDLARIKYFRNKIAHSDDGSLTNADFVTAWDNVSQAIERLGGLTYNQDCINLKDANLDSASYRDILLNISHSQDEKLKELTDKIENALMVTEETKHALEDPVPATRRGIFREEIALWEEMDKKFVETHSSKQLLKMIKSEDTIIITGNAGMGKSFLMRHIALQMKSDGYEVLPIIDPKDILTYTLPNRKTLYVIDDICGKYNVVQNLIEVWEYNSSEIKKSIGKSNCKILSNCRLQVFQSKQFQSLKILSQKQFNMLTSEYSLTTEEKRCIAMKYLRTEFAKKLPADIINQYDCFPLLCTLLTNKDEEKAMLFLKRPYTIFSKELDLLYNKADRLMYCALALVVAFNNSLCESVLFENVEKNFIEVFEDIFEACGESKSSSRQRVKENLDSLNSSYILKHDKMYSFIHPKIYEMAAYYFSKKSLLLNCMLNHCSAAYLCERFIFLSIADANNEFQIELPPSLETTFFDKLMKSANDENILDIFGCKLMNYVEYRTSLISYMKTMNNALKATLLRLSRNGLTIFHLMCKLGHTDVIRFCMDENIEPNSYQDIGLTPLHTACKYEKEDVIDMLLKFGVNTNKYKSAGYTPLYEACKTGKTNVVKKLLMHGADPSLCSDKRLIPLLIATKKGHTGIVDLLCRYKADINQQDENGMSALHLASMTHNVHLLQFLIREGANVDIKTNNEETPLYFACENAYADIVTLLITDNADVFNISARTGLSPISVLLTNGKQDLANDILNNIPNKMFLYSALETASDNNEVKLVDALLLTNIDINVILPSGNTALHIATKNGHFTLVKLLLFHGAYINSQTQEGATPIQLACLNGHEEIVSLLVSEGAKVNVSNINLFVLPPLHISCLLKNKDMASTLINGNADLNETRMLTLQTMSELRENDYINSLFSNDDMEINGMVTPIEIVCMARDAIVLRYLLEKGADSNMKTVQYGIHPLLLACFYKESDMIDMLLHHRSNVNVYENIDNLCLTHIMYHGDEDIIELIAYRRNEKSSSAVTPLHIACVNGNVATVSSVLRFGARTDIATRVSPFVIFTLKQESKTDMACSTANEYLKKYDEIENILPIHLCCFGGNPHIVESVVDSMTEITGDLTIRVNALQIACLHGKFYKNIFGIEAQYYSLDPLQVACLGRHWDICKLLLDNGYDAFLAFDVSEFLISCFTDTKSIFATENNVKISKTSVIEFVYENKAHDLFKYILNATQRFEKSKVCVFHKLFTSACANNEVDFAKLIFRKCVERDERQPSTLLNVACQHNRIDIVDFILSFNKEIEHSNDKSETALHITSMSGFEDLTQLLLKRGFNPFALTHAGENAFHLACKHNHVDCCSILHKYTDDHIYSIYTDIVHWTNIYTLEKTTTTFFALINKNETLLSILLDSGADINLPVGEENETLLFLACKEGRADYVEYFLERSADVNLANCDGETPLMIACVSGHDPIARQLLASNASVNVQANNGYCPLNYACDNNFEITKLLLEKKADPNCLIYDGAESLLIKAVKSGSHKTVELLLIYGSNVNFSLTPGQPALYFAFEAADSKMMKCLLRFNADQHVCCHERANYLYLACKRGMLDIVELILFHDRNIDPNVDYVNGETSLFACYKGMNHSHKTADVVRYKKIGRLLIRFGADINKETKNNDTPFHQLCINSGCNEIDYVLEKCDIRQEYILSEMMFARNQGNITLLHSLIAHYRQPIQNEHFANIWFEVVETNQVEIINLLIERGIDINITNTIRKHCALHIASVRGYLDVVQNILRQENTILDMKSYIHGYTPLHIACLNGHVEICEILINNGANITEKTNTGKSLLQLAFHKSKVMSFLLRSNENEMSKQFQDEIVKFRLLYDQSNEDKEMFRQLIMISNTDFNVDDTDKCIHFACRNEDTDLIQQLITKKCDLNCVNEHGLTPLIISICKNNLENVELLLRGGVPVDENTLILHKGIEECLGTCIPSMANASPLHISCLKKYSKIVEQLVVRNAQLNSHMQVYYSLSAHDSDCEMLSPLFISVMKRDFETVHLLLKSNSDSGLLTFNSVFISSLFNDGTFVENEFFLDYRTDLSSFQAACILGYDDIVDEIIKYYPDINQKFKITPIFLSFFDESCELMHQFLSLYGYDNKDFEIEVTPLIFSVLVGNFKVLKTLLSNFANHEFESSFCLIHVVSLKRNILDILVSTYLEPQELLLSKCTLNALSIACLKNDAEICQLLLSKYADPLYATQLTAMHVICFRGYDSHLECIMELRLPVDRYFRIQCSHIIACSKFDDTNADDLILSSPGFNDVLDISIVELACFHNNVDFLINMIQIIPEQSYNSIMNVTPLFLSCLFGNDGQFQIGMFMSDMKLQSNIPYQMVISRLCIYEYWILDIHDFIVYPLKTLTPRDNMKITNFSLLLKNYCLCICNNDDEDEKALTIKQTVKVSMGKMIPDPIACDEVNLLILLLLDLRREDNIIIMYAASKLLHNIDVCIKVFKLNFTYLLLLKNVSLELLPVSTYSELSQKPLSFTAVEAFYLIHRRIPDSLFLSTEAKYQTLEINPILIACLHENIPNVEFILRRNADINSLNELSLLLLTSFQYNKFDNKLIQSISYQTLVAKINPLHVAILAENIEMTKVLLANGCCVNTSAFLTPFHICVMKKKMTNNSDLVYDDLLTPFLDTVIAGENIDSMCVSIEMKPIHIACFYTENIDFVRILFGRHNCNLKSAAKLSTVVLYFINQDEDFEIALNHNTLEAVSDLTPLNIACLLNNTSLVEYLLTKQIEVDSIGSIFPHHMNFSHCSDIAELITIQSEFILTSLHIALLNDNEDIVGLLIEYGANVDISISLIIELNIGNMYISTHSSLKAIHLACLIDNDNIFGTILSKTTFIDEKCAVSLWHLCYLEVVSGVKMYETFDREIELNLNPMHIFCIIGDCAHVEMLVNADANCNLAAEMPLVYTKINSTARLYKFPLHLAAESGNLEMCTLLLKHNADNEVKTNVIGFKPWHLALYHGHVDVLKHLLTVRTTIRKSLFMFTLFLFILRVRYGNIVIQFIAKSKNVIPLLSFYRYLLNVFGFSLIP